MRPQRFDRLENRGGRGGVKKSGRDRRSWPILTPPAAVSGCASRPALTRYPLLPVRRTNAVTHMLPVAPTTMGNTSKSAKLLMIVVGRPGIEPGTP